jgi:hypothetical protein
LERRQFLTKRSFHRRAQPALPRVGIDKDDEVIGESGVELSPM